MLLATRRNLDKKSNKYNYWIESSKDFSECGWYHRFKAGMWKRKRQIFVEAEAGSAKKGNASTLVIHVEGQKLYGAAIFCVLYDENWMFYQS